MCCTFGRVHDGAAKKQYSINKFLATTRKILQSSEKGASGNSKHLCEHTSRHLFYRKPQLYKYRFVVRIWMSALSQAGGRVSEALISSFVKTSPNEVVVSCKFLSMEASLERSCLGIEFNIA